MNWISQSAGVSEGIQYQIFLMSGVMVMASTDHVQANSLSGIFDIYVCSVVTISKCIIKSKCVDKLQMATPEFICPNFIL